MKPAPFDYVLAHDLDEAVQALAAANGDGKVIAGGQSLIPLLNFRMTRPAVLVDIGGIRDLTYVEDRGERIGIGALTRHHMLETSPLVAARLPVLSLAMQHVAHLAIRNRGTIGGSLSHADPAAELPMMALFYDAIIKVAGSAGRRAIDARDFFIAALTTALEPDEIVYEVEFPTYSAHNGWAFEEIARRSGDFALASIATSLRTEGERIAEARFAVMGASEIALRVATIEQALQGRRLDNDEMTDILTLLQSAISPTSDLHASEAYRRHLAGRLTERALKNAWTRATQGHVQ